MAKKKHIQTYRFNCTITGDEYKTTRQAPNPDELISVEAWYEMHPEKDDRTEANKKKHNITTNLDS